VDFRDQPPPDPLALPLAIDRQIGEVGAVGEIGNRPSDPHQQAAGIPGGTDQVGMAKHRIDPIRLTDRPTLGQSRSMENVEK
jgi:hypothetical protein